MKPSFALDFRDGVIALLHRTTRGWQQVGSTPLDAPDLNDALSYLRATALGLSPRGLATKLVIPNDQILYTRVYAPGPEVAKRRRQIKAALEGLTPYDVEDLVYDWWGSGPEVDVAVVARETLAEAEGFAAEHRFNPVSFVAAPDSGGFVGEPFFGPSALAATLLAEGEKVERDQDPISVVAREFPRAEVAAPSAVVAPVVAGPAVAAAAAEVTASPPLSPPATPIAALDPAPDLAAPSTQIAPAPVPAPGAVEPEAIEPNALPDFSEVRTPVGGAFDPVAFAADLVDEAPMALDVADEASGSDQAAPLARAVPPAAAPSVPPSAAPAVVDEVPPKSAPTILTAFNKARDSVAQAPQDMPGEIVSLARANAAPPLGPALGPVPALRPTVPRPVQAKPAGALPSASREAVPFPPRGHAVRPAIAKGKPAAAAPGIAGARRDRNVVPLTKPTTAPPVAAHSGAPSTDATGVKGLTGLDGRPLPSGQRPRFLGLILTGVLLVALTLVAAWSSYYLSLNEVDPGAAPAANGLAADPGTADPGTADTGTADSGTADSATADSATADPGTAASGTADPGLADPAPDASLPSAEDEALADGQDPSLAAETVTTPADAALQPADLLSGTPDTEAMTADPTLPAPDDAATAGLPTLPAPDVGTALAASAAAAALPAPATSDAGAETLVELPQAAPEPAPGTRVVSDSAVVAAPGSDPQDEIFLASADAPPQTSDPLIMPQAATDSDAPPALAPPPPPFGTVYTFDAAGRIQPTPEGIVTPEGVLLVAGAPRLVPPTRPATVTAVDAPPRPEATALDAAAPLWADPALAGKTPRSRPAGLVAPAATAGQQGEVLAPAQDSRFAAFRPGARPEALTRTAGTDPAANGAAAASLALNGVLPNSSILAVSRRPAARPSGMDQAVEAAVAAAALTPDPQTASLAPEDQPEPELEAAAPQLPASASVSRQATTKDVLNLSHLAVIGIFGSSSGRYAMVRQPGGGVKKIKVGDTIDGGRVAAITASEVQYKKGNRMLALSLPEG